MLLWIIRFEIESFFNVQMIFLKWLTNELWFTCLTQLSVEARRARAIEGAHTLTARPIILAYHRRTLVYIWVERQKT